MDEVEGKRPRHDCTGFHAFECGEPKTTVCQGLGLSATPGEHRALSTLSLDNRAALHYCSKQPAQNLHGHGCNELRMEGSHDIWLGLVCTGSMSRQGGPTARSSVGWQL